VSELRNDLLDIVEGVADTFKFLSRQREEVSFSRRIVVVYYSSRPCVVVNLYYMAITDNVGHAT